VGYEVAGICSPGSFCTGRMPVHPADTEKAMRINNPIIWKRFILADEQYQKISILFSRV
jgi:hypothetical protein